MKYSNVYDHRRCTEFSFLVQLCVRLNESKIGNSQYLSRKDLFIKLSDYLNVKALSPLSFQWNKQLLLAYFFWFFCCCFLYSKIKRLQIRLAQCFLKLFKVKQLVVKKNGGSRLIQILFIPALMSFFCFRTPYFDFSCLTHTQTNKK